MPIENYGLRFVVHPGIKHSVLFLEFEACVAAGLDLEKWYNGKYHRVFMETVIAWYQAHNAVRLHGEDAAQRKAEREAKKKKK